MPSFRPGLEALIAGHAEADKTSDHGAELPRLVFAQLRVLEHGDVALRVLVHGEQVDDADDVRLPQPLELGEVLARELRILEAEDQHLNRTYAHLSPLPRVCGGYMLCRIFVFWISNSASVNTPCS